MEEKVAESETPTVWVAILIGQRWLLDCICFI